MQNPQKGDVVVLGHENIRPRYLNGTKVKITGDGGVRKRGETFDGVVVELPPGAPRNAAFRVNRPVRGIVAWMIHEVIWKEHLEGRYAA